MEKLLDRLPFPDEIHAALMQEKNILYYILETVKAYETGSWWALEQAVAYLNIESGELPKIYENAVNWSDSCRQNL